MRWWRPAPKEPCAEEASSRCWARHVPGAEAECRRVVSPMPRGQALRGVIVPVRSMAGSLLRGQEALRIAFCALRLAPCGLRLALCAEAERRRAVAPKKPGANAERLWDLALRPSRSTCRCGDVQRRRSAPKRPRPDAGHVMYLATMKPSAEESVPRGQALRGVIVPVRGMAGSLLRCQEALRLAPCAFGLAPCALRRG